MSSADKVDTIAESENATVPTENLATSPEKRSPEVAPAMNGHASPDPPFDPLAEPTRFFAMGKREFLLRDYSAAVENFVKALELKRDLYDEFAEELGDNYFYYGKALFLSSRAEAGVLGDKIEKDKGEEENDDEDDEEDEEGGGGDEDAPAEGSEEKKESDDKKETEDSSEKKESDDKKETEDSSEKKDAEESEAKDETEKMDTEDSDTPKVNGAHEAGGGDTEKSADLEDSEKPGDQTEGEPDDLQLAWEVLEVAKIIFQKGADNDRSIASKLAEVYLTLGEIGLESENYESAINDFNACLFVQQKYLSEEIRRIAETYYQLGISYSMQEAFDDAIVKFKESITQLERRLDHLKRIQESGIADNSETSKDAFYTVDGEIVEINSAINDIKEKIGDMEDHKQHTKNELAKHITNTIGSSVPSSDGASTSAAAAASSSTAEEKPVTNISHLIRKKRKTEEEDKGEGNEEKKAKHDEAAN